ncbi:MAG: outer membrane protein assembly factor BamB [Gammaproteobacteria bacterium]
MNKLWFFFLVSCVFVVTGCSSLSSGVKKYEEPSNFKQEVVFDTVWSTGDSSGWGNVQMNLSPNFVMHKGQQWVAVPDYRGHMLVLDAFSGEKIWRESTKMDFSSAAGEADDAIVMGTSDGHVIAMNKENGEILWDTTVSSEVLAAPRGNNDALVVLTIDSRLHGLDAKTGKEIWTYDATAPALTLRGAASPLIIEDMAFVGFSNGQVALFKLSNGQMIWLESAAKPRGRNEIQRMVDIDGTMARVDNTVYVVTYQGNLLAIDLPSLEVTWSHPLSSYVGLTVSGNDLIVTDDDDTLYAIDRVTGETRWKQEALVDRYLSAPAIYENYVVVGDGAGYVYAFALDNGRMLGYEHVVSDDIRAPVLVDKQGVIVQSRTGRVEKVTISTSPKQVD